MPNSGFISRGVKHLNRSFNQYVYKHRFDRIEALDYINIGVQFLMSQVDAVEASGQIKAETLLVYRLAVIEQVKTILGPKEEDKPKEKEEESNASNT